MADNPFRDWLSKEVVRAQQLVELSVGTVDKDERAISRLETLEWVLRRYGEIQSAHMSLSELRDRFDVLLEQIKQRAAENTRHTNELAQITAQIAKREKSVEEHEAAVTKRERDLNQVQELAASRLRAKKILEEQVKELNQRMAEAKLEKDKALNALKDARKDPLTSCR